MKKILITGGFGMVGSQFVGEQYIKPPHSQLDLTDYNSLNKFIEKNEPFNAIIHLAAKVGGVKANTNLIGDFASINIEMNQNVLTCSVRNRIPKVISLLSTCVYPDASYVTYPLTEEQLHMGPPHKSNFGYAYAKRFVDVQSRAFRQQYDCNFITAIPNNLYGEGDNYEGENSHVIPAITRRIWEAKLNNSPTVEIWGDGTPLREFTYSGDISRIIMFLLENYNGEHPINIGNTQEISIKDTVNIIKEELGYSGNIIWNIEKPSGQFRKPSSNKKLLSLGWGEKDYTPFNVGIKRTCEWFKKSYPNVRGAR